MLADKEWQLPLVCAVIFSSYVKWLRSENKRCCWQQETGNRERRSQPVKTAFDLVAGEQEEQFDAFSA